MLWTIIPRRQAALERDLGGTTRGVEADLNLLRGDVKSIRECMEEVFRSRGPLLDETIAECSLRWQ